MRALVLTGGGARGAYQAGATLALSEILATNALPFPILSGSSAGSINAAYLASRADEFRRAAKDLADLWSSLEPRNVFRTDPAVLAKTAGAWLTDLGLGGFIGTGRGTALLDTTPLSELLSLHLDSAAIRGHIASDRVRAVGITATAYRTGLGLTFFDGRADVEPWDRVTRSGRRAVLGIEHVLASSAIPMFFPAVAIGGEWYADGCIRLSTPLSPVIHMGAERIVAIAVSHAADRKLGPVGSPAPYPSTAETAGLLLDALFVDALESDLERALRINQTLRLLPPQLIAQHVTPLRQLSVLVLRPSLDPALLVVKALERFPAAVRHLFRGLGATSDAGWDLLSYLAFEGEYTTRLMELGYSDTSARADEIRTFLE